MTEQDILNLIKNDPWRMRVLEVAASLELPDWLIGAGFVRNIVWDHLHGFVKATPPTDIDLAYFDAESRFSDRELEGQLIKLMPNLTWEVVNQATAYKWNGEAPHTSTADGISKWPETATAVGVLLDRDELRLIAPHGIDDLINLVARPTPNFSLSERKRLRVQERINQKHWLEKWPKLRIEID